jgi:hypothetical protein
MKARLVTLIAALASAGATSTTPSRTATPQAPRYAWFDGDHARTLFLAADLVAEFRPSDDGAVAIRSADSAATAIDAGGWRGVRLWRVPAGAGDVVRALSGRIAVSPVFFESGPGAGRKRALPGGVVVVLDPLWDASRVAASIAANRLRVVRKLEMGNVLVLDSPAGFASLDLANTLHGADGVVASEPNWWVESFPR